DRTLGFRDFFGDYQRHLFLIDHAGLPLKTVLEQLDELGEILPTLRAELAKNRPPHVPDAPTHGALVAQRRAAGVLPEVPGEGEPVADTVTGRAFDPSALR